MRFMRLFWVVALCAALPLAPARIASAAVEFHVGLAYEMSSDVGGNTCTLPNVAVPGDDASLTQVSVAPGGQWVHHVFNVYATVTGLSADQDLVFMMFGGTGTGGVTTGGSTSYTANSYTVDPPAMGPPTSDAPADVWSNLNGFNGVNYVVSVQRGAATGGAQGNTYGDYAAYMQLGESGSVNAPAPFLIGQQVLTCDSLGRYSFSFNPAPGYLKIISGNANGAALDASYESYPVYSGFGDSALFAPRNATDLTWADGATATWAVADGSNHWTQTASPSTSDNFYHLDAVRFTSNTLANRTVTLAGALNPASVIVDSSDDYAFTGSGRIVGAGTTLTKKGTGKLTIGNTGTNAYTGLTTLEAGTLQLNGASAQNPVLNLGGADIQTGLMVFDFSAGGTATDPAATILSDLTASYNHGVNAWTTGKFLSSTALANGTTLGWSDNTTSSPIVRGTNVFPADSFTVMATLPGDANLDGTVDGTDYGLVIGNYNHPGGWAQGDFNYDGVVDGADYGYIIGNYNHSFVPGAIVSGAAGATAVPEPGTIALLGCGLIGLLAYAWRKRK